MDTQRQFDVAVLGAGPAAAAVAIGLARLGHAVCTIGTPRAFDACEGVSERVLGALAAAGLHAALATVPEPSPRSVCWNGESRAANSERLLWRRDFDAALPGDLRAAGVRVHETQVRALERTQDGGLRIAHAGGVLQARLVVDARGRVAPRAGRARVRGPETVSLLQHWQGAPCAPCAPASAVFAFADGWAWLARRAGGTRHTQFTLAADAPALPKRAALADHLRERIAALPEAGAWIEGCTPLGPPRARSSTAILQAPLFSRGVLRAGDAAMAVDPLSGNGIFQALSSASVAPAVLNTLLREPGGERLALDFYAARVEHVFLRFARIGRDFYRSETRWAAEPFWRARAAWPDAEPAHGAIEPRVLGIARRAVIDNGFVREREVVLTSDQPLGVWRVADVEAAGLLRDLPADSVQREALLRARLDQAAARNPRVRQALENWCERLGIVQSGQQP